MHSSIIATLIKEGFGLIREVYKERDKKLSVNESDIENAIATHINYITNWYSDINFRDLKSPKLLDDIYIDLNFESTPERLKFRNEPTELLSLKEILSKPYNKIIVGLPGSGKSTTMKKICQLVLSDELFFNGVFKVPIVLRFRELRTKTHWVHQTNHLYQWIFDVVGLKIKADKKEKKEDWDKEINNITKLICESVIRILDSLKVILILDGYDELVDETLRYSIIEDLRSLSLRLSESEFIITSRTGEFNLQIENTSEYQIARLNNEQVKNFVKQYFNKKGEHLSFLEQIQNKPFSDVTTKPLTIAHLCAIYERYGKIPEKPKSVYRKVVNLYLEEWNAQNSLRRVSAYGNFEVERKFDFLCHLSFYLSVTKKQFSFSKRDILEAYREISPKFQLPKNEEQKVVDELESHTGLFIQSGYENYEFIHRSVQEFLTAEYIVRLPRFTAKEKLLSTIPNELALTIALSSNANFSFSDIVISKLKGGILRASFFPAFVDRLFSEKPDFLVDETLGITCGYIYTLEKTVSSEVTKKSFLSHMSLLLTSNEIQESFKLLPEYYFSDKSQIDKEGYTTLTCINKYASKSKGIPELPNYLYIPFELMEEIYFT